MLANHMDSATIVTVMCIIKDSVLYLARVHRPANTVIFDAEEKLGSRGNRVVMK